MLHLFLYVPAAFADRFVCSESTSDVDRYDDASGAYIDTFVTPGSGGLSTPEGLVFSPDGNLCVAGASSDNVVRYDGTTGAFIDVFVSFGSGGLANGTGILFFTPQGPAVPAFTGLGLALLGEHLRRGLRGSARPAGAPGSRLIPVSGTRASRRPVSSTGSDPLSSSPARVPVDPPRPKLCEPIPPMSFALTLPLSDEKRCGSWEIATRLACAVIDESPPGSVCMKAAALVKSLRSSSQ